MKKMKTYVVAEKGDPLTIYTHDQRELMCTVDSIDYDAKSIIIVINQDIEALSFEDVEGAYFHEMPRALKMINSGNIDSLATDKATTRSYDIHSGLYGEGGFWSDIANHFDPPKPPPCRQPVKGGGGTYHPIGQAKDGGCCCGCGGIGMQYY